METSSGKLQPARPVTGCPTAPLLSTSYHLHPAGMHRSSQCSYLSSALRAPAQLVCRSPAMVWGDAPSQSRPTGAVTELSGWFTSQRREPWRLPQASSSQPDQSRDVRPPHSSQHPTTYTQLECTDRVSVPTCPLPCVHQLSWFAGLLPWSGGTHLARGNPRRTFTRATFTEEKKK
jgi:hypothetical protein